MTPIQRLHLTWESSRPTQTDQRRARKEFEAVWNRLQNLRAEEPRAKQAIRDAGDQLLSIMGGSFVMDGYLWARASRRLGGIRRFDCEHKVVRTPVTPEEKRYVRKYHRAVKHHKAVLEAIAEQKRLWYDASEEVIRTHGNVRLRFGDRTFIANYTGEGRVYLQTMAQ